jgi:hypothetical protein
MNRVKQRLADFPKLSVNDDLKIDWDEKVMIMIFQWMMNVYFAAPCPVPLLPRRGRVVHYPPLGH